MKRKIITIQLDLPVNMPDGEAVSSVGHRELCDADDDFYDQAAPEKSQTELLANTCIEANGAPCQDIARKREVFRRMAIPVRDRVLFLILQETDPAGMVTKDLQCRCGHRWRHPAVSGVPVEPRPLTAETVIELVSPIDVETRGATEEAFTVTALRLRIGTGMDQEAVAETLRRSGTAEARRVMRARMIAEAVGLPSEKQAVARNTLFLRRLHKVDQKRIDQWIESNRTLDTLQAAKCPQCQADVRHLWDADPFF